MHNPEHSGDDPLALTQENFDWALDRIGVLTERADAAQREVDSLRSQQRGAVSAERTAQIIDDLLAAWLNRWDVQQDMIDSAEALMGALRATPNTGAVSVERTTLLMFVRDFARWQTTADLNRLGAQARAAFDIDTDVPGRCPACDGRGWAYPMNHAPELDGTIPCSVCDGTGKTSV